MNSKFLLLALVLLPVFGLIAQVPAPPCPTCKPPSNGGGGAGPGAPSTPIDSHQLILFGFAFLVCGYFFYRNHKRAQHITK